MTSWILYWRRKRGARSATSSSASEPPTELDHLLLFFGAVAVVAVAVGFGCRGGHGAVLGCRCVFLGWGGLERRVGRLAWRRARLRLGLLLFDRCGDLGGNRRILGFGKRRGRAFGSMRRLRGLGRRFRHRIAGHGLVRRDLGGLARRRFDRQGVALDRSVVAGGLTLAPAAAMAAAAAMIVVGIAFARVAGVGLDQRLPVGDRDLVIIRVDFAERQEAVTVAAVVDERRLQRRFDPGNLG